MRDRVEARCHLLQMQVYRQEDVIEWRLRGRMMGPPSPPAPLFSRIS